MAGGPISMTRGDRVRALRVLVPVAVAVAIALMPPPPGLAPHAWHYVAIFAATAAALVLEPVPSPAVGLIAVAAVAVLAPWVLFGPSELAPRYGVRRDLSLSPARGGPPDGHRRLMMTRRQPGQVSRRRGGAGRHRGR